MASLVIFSVFHGNFPFAFVVLVFSFIPPAHYFVTFVTA